MPIQPSRENLQQYAAPPLAGWLIHAARRGSSIFYGQAKRRLETEIGFSTIFSTHIGIPAGTLMDRILEARPDCPLLNVLLVNQDGLGPGTGARGYMATYLNRPALRNRGYRNRNRRSWRAAAEEIAADVYAFDEWHQVYLEAFGQPLPPFAVPQGHEAAGGRGGGQGEGRRHEQLRHWVMRNPGEINPAYAGFRAETEVVLESADRVDVVFYGPDETVAIEVKSIDSNEADLRRGVFQCIKYRAVMKAMDVRSKHTVTTILVTQERLPGDLTVLARSNRVRRFLAPRL